MSEWIDIVSGIPPVSLDVILCVEHTNPKHPNYSHRVLLVGFWGHEDLDPKNSFFMCTLYGVEPIIENEYIKVLAWTLLPEKPRHLMVY